MPINCFEYYRFKAWGNKDPHRPAEDVAFGVALFFQTGGTLNNYYMVSNFDYKFFRNDFNYCYLFLYLSHNYLIF